MRIAKRGLSFVSLLLVVTAGVLVFQNCGMTVGSFAVVEDSKDLASQSVDSLMPITHPAQKTVTAPTKKYQVVNRDYIESLFRELFTDSDGTPAPQLESLLLKWVIQRGAQLGLACDLNSSYTGRDCGGDTAAANLLQLSDHSSIRESFLIQLCEGVLGSDDGLRILLNKTETEGILESAPNFINIQKLFYLFYRTTEGSSQIITPLIELDRTLESSEENLKERWRAISIEVCESPGWQRI